MDKYHQPQVTLNGYTSSDEGDEGELNYYTED